MIYIYKMHAGMLGTDETFWSTEKVDEWEYAVDHAESFGNEIDEDDEWLEGEPECWLEGTVTTLQELDKHLGSILRGNEREEDLVADIAKAGVILT